jgi:hypothetical protein
MMYVADMNTNIGIALAIAVSFLAACGAGDVVEQARHPNPKELRCAYEARKAFAGARERSIGDSIDNAVQEAKLRRMCLGAT